MNRKEIASETVRIMRQGFYTCKDGRVEFAAEQRRSEENSRLIRPEQGEQLINSAAALAKGPQARCTVTNEPTVRAIRDVAAGNSKIGVLNFASAKNPGGGFLNGAMAQEESLAASSGLYGTLLRHESYYEANRACGSMMYTDHAIYSPDVVFFRDERFQLLNRPVAASVLTLPAVNYGQVLRKGENAALAEKTMKNRMRLALAIFACQGDKHLILGAYGCGVFRNDPVKVARWWRELLEMERYGELFSEIRFAVLDNPQGGRCIRAFTEAFSYL